MDQITLRFKQGSSHKGYQAALKASGDKFAVNSAHGQRGGSLQTRTKRTKGKAAVHYDAATAICGTRIKEKVAKGYTGAPDGRPYLRAEKAQRVSEINCQLPDLIEESEAHRLIIDPAFVMQEKFDGRRQLIRKDGDTIGGITRNGLCISLPQTIVEEARDIPGNYTIDGEAIGDVIWAFDLLEIHGSDVRSQPYRERLLALTRLIPAEFGFIKLAETAFNTIEKAALLERLRKENRKGAVFKKRNAPYTSRHPGSAR